MSGKPMSIYLSRGAMKCIAPSDALSPRINQALERFIMITGYLAKSAQESMPPGAIEQLRDVFAGREPFRDAFVGAAAIGEAIQSLGIILKRELTMPERVALLEMVERHVSAPN